MLLKVGYGIDVDDENHEILQVIDAALEGTALTFVPGKFLVDIFPSLAYVPAWIPGAGFQKLFAQCREAAGRMREMPFAQRNTAYVSSRCPTYMR